MRIPLYLKLMASYLFVFGLVFFPTFYFLRTGLVEEVRSVLQQSLERDVVSVAARIGELPAHRMAAAIDALVRTMPERVTVVDLQGTVLGDSVATDGRKLENHLDRPEIYSAFAQGTGHSMRRSKTTGSTLIYIARRFPESGPARGVVRLSLPIDHAEQAGERLSSFVNHSGAVALSAAVLLSLLAAMVVSRPLRRIAASARAFAAGDFGYQVNVRSRDELGEVAQALEELAAQLRGRLVEAGADRTTLRALLDDLPVGVVLFDRDKRAVVLNGQARLLCSLSPAHELDDANRLLQLPEQEAAASRVLASTVSEEVPLAWISPSATNPRAVRLRARWVAIAGVSGEPLPAVILREDDDRAAMAVAHRQGLLRWCAKLRGLAADGALTDHERCAAIATLAEEIHAEVAPLQPAPSEVGAVALSDLCARALAVAAPIARARSVALVCDLSEPDVQVVEAVGRVEQAVGSMLCEAARVCEDGASLQLHDELQASQVLLRLRVKGAAWDAGGIAASLAALGGDAGCQQDHDLADAWVAVPRA